MRCPAIVRRIHKDRKGNTTPLTMALVLGLLLLLCAMAELMRLSIIVKGVRDAMQGAVIAVATENYDEVYHGLREGYSGGYWLYGEDWEENLDEGDIYGQLDELLGMENEGGYHVKPGDGTYEYRISGLSVDMENVGLRPGNAETNLEVTACVRLEVPLAFAWAGMQAVDMEIRARSAYMPKFSQSPDIR